LLLLFFNPEDGSRYDSLKRQWTYTKLHGVTVGTLHSHRCNVSCPWSRHMRLWRPETVGATACRVSRLNATTLTL
jgi:hypothetical protein